MEGLTTAGIQIVTMKFLGDTCRLLESAAFGIPTFPQDSSRLQATVMTSNAACPQAQYCYADRHKAVAVFTYHVHLPSFFVP